MRMFWLILLALSFLFGTSCAGFPVYRPLSAAACPQACENMVSLQCDPSEPETYQECLTFCVETMGNGYDLRLHCAVNANTCGEFHACEAQ